VARFVCLVALAFWTTSTALASGSLPQAVRQRLSIRVSPAVSFAPADLVVRAVIDANPDNRTMEITAESADFYRSSEVQLDGARAPRTSLFEFPNLPRGTYEVRAVLRGSGGRELAFARDRINVVPGAKGS
jgi:hypothetical protein